MIIEDEIIPVFYRIYNSFPSIENSRANEKAFDCLPFRSKMKLQRSMISILKNFHSEIDSAVERTSSRTKLPSYLNHFLTNRHSMDDEKSRTAAIVLKLES